jgi:hypothetical protein
MDAQKYVIDVMLPLEEYALVSEDDTLHQWASSLYTAILKAGLAPAAEDSETEKE